MGTFLHSVEMATGSNNTFGDKLKCYYQTGVANGSAAAGVDVTTAVSLPAGEFPASYMVLVDVNGQDVFASITSKTVTGFNVVLTPKTAAATVSAGTFDVLVIA